MIKEPWVPWILLSVATESPVRLVKADKVCWYLDISPGFRYLTKRHDVFSNVSSWPPLCQALGPCTHRGLFFWWCAWPVALASRPSHLRALAVFGINYADRDFHVELPKILEHARDIKHRKGQIPFPELVCCSLCRGKTRRNNGNRPCNPDRLHKSPTE